MLKFLNIESGMRKLREILASYISYDNSNSGLVSNNVQDAVDEIALNSGAIIPDSNLDGGFANSVYLSSQHFDAGDANG